MALAIVLLATGCALSLWWLTWTVHASEVAKEAEREAQGKAAARHRGELAAASKRRVGADAIEAIARPESMDG